MINARVLIVCAALAIAVLPIKANAFVWQFVLWEGATSLLSSLFSSEGDSLASQCKSAHASASKEFNSNQSMTLAEVVAFEEAIGQIQGKCGSAVSFSELANNAAQRRTAACATTLKRYKERYRDAKGFWFLKFLDKKPALTALKSELEATPYAACQGQSEAYETLLKEVKSRF